MTAPAEPTPADPAAPPADPAEPQDVKSLPDWAQDQIRKARDEAARYRTQVRELEPKASKLDELTRAQQTAEERAAEERRTLEARATAAESTALRMEVAAAKGVPLSQASRLVGSTREELEADAEQFLKDMKPAEGETPPPSFDGGPRGTAPAAGDDMNSRIRQAAGR